MTSITKPSTDFSAVPPDQLCQQMRAIRRELGQDVEEIVEHAERLMDWRYYVQRHPWASVGVAIALGYFVMPRRSLVLPTDESTLARLAQRIPVTVQAPVPPKRSSLFRVLLTMGTSLAMRAALSYLSQRVGTLVGQPSTIGEAMEVDQYA